MNDKRNEQILFSINTTGLSTGTYNYEFAIDQKLFENFKNEEIQKVQLQGELALTVRPNIVEATIKIVGKVLLICDRCLGYFEHQINLKESAIIKQKGKVPDNETNIIIFDPVKGQIDLDQYFYDMIVTALPMQRLHSREEDCDPEMIKRIEEEKNHSSGIDPRWNDLKNLI